MPFPQFSPRARCAALLVTTSVIACPVQAKPRRAPKPPAPPAPVVVKFRDPLGNPADPAYRIAAKLRLEPGALVNATCFLDREKARADRDLAILLATERVEGGFDAVNIYDRGVLSWGMMQWAAHANSLQDALWYVKNRLAEKDRADTWAALFKAYGLDVQRQPDGTAAFCVGGTDRVTGVTSWRPVTGIDNLRVLFRGTKTVGKYDPATAALWAKVFARAGRNPVVQTLQTEWATRRVHEALSEAVDGRWAVRDFTGGDVFSDALYFAFWTNNPRASREHFARAVRQTRQITGEADPSQWPPALFPFVWESVGRNSAFGTWPSRTESVAETIGAGAAGRRLAQVALASRGWRTDRLGHGTSILRAGVRGAGSYWRREPPAPPLQFPVPGAPLFFLKDPDQWVGIAAGPFRPQETRVAAGKR
jgi:hypothetical protein